jgi:hypothetical protein
MTKIIHLALSPRADLIIAIRDRDTAALPKPLTLHQDTVLLT